MKKLIRRIAIITVIITMAFGMVACGDTAPANDPNRLIYVADYNKIDLGLAEDEWATGQVINNGIMYFVVTKYNNATETTSTQLCSKSLTDDSATVRKDFKFASNGYVSSMSINSDGTLLVVGESYDDKNGKSNNTIMTVNTDGEIIQSIDLADTMSKVNMNYTQTIICQGDNIFMLGSNDQGCVIAVTDKNGKYLFDITNERWFDEMFLAPDGKVYVSGYGAETMELRPIDLASKSLGDALDIDVDNARGYYKGKNNSILISSDLSVKEYNLDSKETTILWNWLDLDMNTDNIVSCSYNNDGTYTIMLSNYADESVDYEIATISQKKASEVKQKITLVYGVLYLDYTVKNEIVDFNKTNPEYRISVKCYSDEYSDWDEASNKMNLDIATGNTLDIIDLSNVQYFKQASSGVLEDLNPYFENDTQLKRSDYFENILNALEVDGKLMAIAPSFSVETLVGRKSDIGNKSSWTIDDMIALTDANPDKELLDYTSKESMLYTLLLYNMDNYIDWEKGDCKFESDEFIKVINYANRFPLETVADGDNIKKLQEGKQLLTQLYLRDVENLQIYKSIMGGDVNLIGFPTSEGSGSTVSINGLIGMSSKSKNKDGVWQFIRNFLLDEYQTSKHLYDFPLMKSAYEAKMEEAMTPNMSKDENGVMQENPKGSYGFGNSFEYEYYHATQEEVDLLTETINSVDKVLEYDDKVFEIITEETEAFFKGQKSAEDVATIIQSRVKIYVTENK